MLGNYMKITFRNLRKNKVYSLINISGLAIGLACCLLLLFFVQDELSYDRFHEKADRIYRVVLDRGWEGERALVPMSMAAVMKQNYPEIAQTTQINPDIIRAQDVLVSHGDKRFYYPRNRFFVVDQNFLDMFTFPLLRGAPETSLKKPFSILLTRAMAENYFGRGSAG